MRPLLPAQEYRLLKNRKCARETRKKRKAMTNSTIDQLQVCQDENKELRKQVDYLERRLQELESALQQREDLQRDENFQSQLPVQFQPIETA